jgi:hypothetical protein
MPSTTSYPVEPLGAFSRGCKGPIRWRHGGALQRLSSKGRKWERIEIKRCRGQPALVADYFFKAGGHPETTHAADAKVCWPMSFEQAPSTALSLQEAHCAVESQLSSIY